MIEKLKAIWLKIKEWALWLWDWAKRIFGRSKTVFSNVMAVIAAGWIELADPIAAMDWDSIVDKHAVVVVIGIAVQLLNVYFKMFADNGRASFRRLNDDPNVDPLPPDDVEPDVEAVETSPKAN